VGAGCYPESCILPPDRKTVLQFMNHLNMNLSAIRPPIAFAAKNARFVSNFPQGPDELWMADLKACRHDVQCEVFEDILFVESNGTAFIYGVEFEDGYPKGLKPDLALKQQSFIQFLRDETRRDNDALGLTALISPAMNTRPKARQRLRTSLHGALPS